MSTGPDLTPERLVALRAVAEAATPGPWVAEEGSYPDDWPVVDGDGNPLCVSPDDGVRGGHSGEDADHIATFDPPTALALLDEVERLREALAPVVEYVNVERCYTTLGNDGHANDVRLVMRDLRAAEAERDEALHRISVMLCDLTGGKLSKPHYDARTMVSEVESHFEDLHQEESADLRAERDRLAAVVERVKALADRWDRAAELAMHADSREWCAVASRSIRDAIEGDGGES